MAVVPLTLAISLLLVATFIVFFLREHARGASSSPERDSLLPLDEETPHVVKDQETTDPPSPPHPRGFGAASQSKIQNLQTRSPISELRPPIPRP